MEFTKIEKKILIATINFILFTSISVTSYYFSSCIRDVTLTVTNHT